jgi:hypothetical protein
MVARSARRRSGVESSNTIDWRNFLADPWRGGLAADRDELLERAVAAVQGAAR